MPQIGWFEILIVIVISILIIGPKEFPIVLRKMGSFIGSIKKYFYELQSTVQSLDENVIEDIDLNENKTKNIKENKDGK